MADLTKALCRIAEQAQPAILRELDGAAGGKLSSGGAQALKLATVSVLEALCSGSSNGEDLAEELGLRVVRQGGRVFVTMGEEPSSTAPPPAGGWKPNWNEKPGKPEKPCCKSCGMGGTCEATCPNFDPEASDDDPLCDFLGSDGPAPVPSRIPFLPPGFWNCRRWADYLAPCQLRKIIRAKRRWTVTADTSLGTFVQVTWDDGGLQAPPGHAYYRLILDRVGISHTSCPRSFEVKNRAGDKVQIDDVAIAPEMLYQAPEGDLVFAWDYPKPEDPDYIKITEGRCECARLCACVPPESRLALYVLLPILPAGDKYTVKARGMRRRWCWPCGACPPELICEREPVTNCQPCDCHTTTTTSTAKGKK